MSNYLWAHGLQHARLPCPSLSRRVCSSSCSLNRGCYLTISSSATLFSFCLQSFPTSGSFPMSQLFTSGSRSTGVSASALVLPMSIQGWLWESHFLGRLIRSLGVPKERGVWNSQGGRKDKLFFPLHSLGLYNNNVSCLRTVSGFLFWLIWLF